MPDDPLSDIQQEVDKIQKTVIGLSPLVVGPVRALL
jgi:hypothetical protein